jgi:5'-nucleotidase
MLASALAPIGTVYVVAPDRERSASSHSLTLHRPLRVSQLGPRVYAIDGTPTDCISLAVHKLLPRKPDLIVSGINRGCNLGEDVTYSGTVSAAMEGTLLGIPSMAVSLAAKNKFNFTAASAVALQLAKKILKEGLPKDTLLNVNVPSVRRLKGYRITTQGKRYFGDVVVEKLDPRGNKYYWIGGEVDRWEGGPGCDFYAIEKSYISVTPLHLDLTNHSSMQALKDWNL